MINFKPNILFENGLEAKEIWQPLRFEVGISINSGRGLVSFNLDESKKCENITIDLKNKVPFDVYWFKDNSECYVDFGGYYILINNIPKDLTVNKQTPIIRITDCNGVFLTLLE